MKANALLVTTGGWLRLYFKATETEPEHKSRAVPPHGSVNGNPETFMDQLTACEGFAPDAYAMSEAPRQAGQKAPRSSKIALRMSRDMGILWRDNVVFPTHVSEAEAAADRTLEPSMDLTPEPINVGDQIHYRLVSRNTSDPDILIKNVLRTRIEQMMAIFKRQDMTGALDRRAMSTFLVLSDEIRRSSDRWLLSHPAAVTPDPPSNPVIAAPAATSTTSTVEQRAV